ncbi:PREDICTED: LOC110419733 [Prunus dulcis]|uniref:PREDICTED: LOC110419733 n=1 Tax=Prunus dulcis TaxID=3755 RepID=A0A5E4G2L0_PRUDU|nr:uncharacterized protein LOC117622514 isoform X1 [Prunus dulcis]XP_034209099.1 uncharacterized protein LOC117622514 isoform X1 [Prunus dulcis]VVA33893.1 PREDICTED: LOC110419733 [Prunus dulcis]
MITMDVNGITWVGGVYEKFESMCLEVEENMYQDTVKFVENQVQTVGASVKKFYADVMQDLLPDSLMDPEKMSACGFPVENIFDVDNSKSSRITKKEEPIKPNVEHLNRDSEVISSVKNKGVDHKPSFREQHMYDYRTQSAESCAEEACLDLYSRQDHDGNMFNNTNLAVKENPTKHRCPQAIPPAEKDLGGQSSSCHETHKGSCEHIDTFITPSLDEGMACDSTREGRVIANASQCTADVSIGCHSSDMIVLDKSDAKEWNEILDSSFGGLSLEPNASDICFINGVVSLVGSSPSGQVQCERYAEKEVSASHPGGSHDSNLDAIESNIVVVQEMETIQQSAKAKLEETCVMVTGEDVHFVRHMEGKRRPYKKKLQKAFSSRMRSARKQEYEQLALWYGDDAKSNLESEDGVLHSITMEEMKKSPSRDFCESEWEIL